jgi:hypothetical protein
MTDATIYSIREDSAEFFPEVSQEFFRIVDQRTQGRVTIRAVAIREDGAVDWLDARTFDAFAEDLEAVQ